MEQAKLKDVTVMWAFFDKVNDLSGKYQVDLCNLTPQHVEALSAIDVEVKNNPNKPEKGFFITCKSTKPIHPLAADGSLLKQVIGNGSKANVLIGTYEWTFKNKKGISPSLAKMVVTDLKEIKSEEEDDDGVL